MRLCMLRASFRHNNHSCINNYNLVTSSWLEYFFSQERIPHHSHHSSSHHPPPTASSVHYCTNQSDRSFAMHIRNRRSCIAECHQPDCLSESYSFVTESSGKGAEYEKVNKTNVKNSTHVTIWPDRKMYEVVQHYKEIDIFQLIGALGGNSHLFLGILGVFLRYFYDFLLIFLLRTLGYSTVRRRLQADTSDQRTLPADYLNGSTLCMQSEVLSERKYIFLIFKHQAKYSKAKILCFMFILGQNLYQSIAAKTRQRR